MCSIGRIIQYNVAYLCAMSESGVYIGKGPGRRNFFDPPSETSLSSCLVTAHTDKKRKAAALTVDNADIVFTECFDIGAFTKFLDQTFDASHDCDLIFTFMKASVIDPKVGITPGFTPLMLQTL
jgi:hypothetical protein